MVTLLVITHKCEKKALPSVVNAHLERMVEVYNTRLERWVLVAEDDLV